MNPLARLFRVAAPVLLFAFTSSFAAIRPGAQSATRQTVQIDGVECPVLAWRGGDAVATAAASGGGAAGQLKTRAVAVRVEPLELDLPIPFDPAIEPWIEDFLAGHASTRALELATYGYDGTPGHPALRLTGARIVEFRLPALDASAGHDRLTATVVIEAAGSQRAAIGTAKPAIGTKPTILSRSGFSLDLAGLETTGVAKIAAITWRGGNTPRELTLELRGSAGVAGWTAWYDSFVAQGNSADANEKSGRLDFLSAAGKAATTLQLKGVGLLQFAPTVSEQSLVWKVRLYVEGASLSGTAAAAAAPAPAASPADATPAPTIAENQGGDPADAGARDPKEFPRPEGTVRKSFRTSETKDQHQEFAAYTAKPSLGELVEFYAQALARAGWKQLDRVENESGAERRRSVLMNWSNGGRWAQLAISAAPGGPSSLDVRIDTKK